MAKTRTRPIATLQKRPTSIAGFDAISGGGLPSGRATILIGAAGSGKTVFSLQTLAGAAHRGEPGIFVAFEEEADSIMLNASSFGWGIPELIEKRLYIFNANISPDVVQSGDFTLGGLLAAVGALASGSRARWVVFDALDVLLSLLESQAARRRELFRIQAWLKSHALTCIMTMKEDQDGVPSSVDRESVSYIADCVVYLEQRSRSAVASRSMRILKYRGSAYSENSAPYWIGKSGMEIDAPLPYTQAYPVFQDRIATGVERLDTMLGAGIFRGSTTLLTGAPGTSKTTLSGKFAEAACQRGEKTLYVCFDEAAQEVVRNLRSVGIDFGTHVTSGCLCMHSAITRQRSADSIYAEIHDMLKSVNPSFVVIDPISALRAIGNEGDVLDAVHRIVQQCKLRGITSYLTSVVSHGLADIENSDTNVSMLADNWIHLSYLVRGGERNRALTIVKARGTGHSNQVRELILSDSGVTLTDVFAEGGEVLMGSMRAQKEGAMELARDMARRELAHKVQELESGAAELEENIVQMQRELEESRRQLELLKRESAAAEETRIVRRDALVQGRGVDAPKPEAPPPPPPAATAAKAKGRAR